MLYQIMYSSQATVPMTAAALEEILADARAGNQARNVTGALVYADGVFFQIIEGEQDVVLTLLASIASDSRHKDLKVFYEAEVDARSFASWRMAYLSASAGQMSSWAGLPGTTTLDELLAEVKGNPDSVPRMLPNILQALAQR